MSRAHRLFGLAQFLEARSGHTLEEIAAHFAVSARTVFRDLAALEEQGLLVEHLDGGRYRIESARAAAPTLDSTDLALVRVALADLPQSAGDAMTRRFARLVQKVENALRGPSAAGRRSDADPELERRELDRLIAARRPAIFLYRALSGGGETVRRADPWQLFQRAGAWYLAARCHHHDEPRLFRLERVRAVQAGHGRYTPPGDFDVERFFAGAWSRVGGGTEPDGVEVALRLTADAAEALSPAARLADERRTRRADGAVELRGRARDLDHAARLAFELGEGATALEPRELRVRVRRLASATLRAR